MTKAAKSVALTFDTGWERQGTSEILDILRQTNLWVTLFLSGQFLRRYPDLVCRMAEDGHEIGNHTYTHPYLAAGRGGPTQEGITRAVLHQELGRTESTFQEVTGHQMSPFWRAPYGFYNDELLGWALELGYKHVYWTLDTKDWVPDPAATHYRTATQIRDQVVNRAIDGDIVLMHISSLRASDRPWEELQAMITRLRQRRFDLAMVSELFARQAQRLASPPRWRRTLRNLSMALADERETLLRSLRLRGQRPR